MNKIVNSILAVLLIFISGSLLVSSCTTTSNVQKIKLDNKYGEESAVDLHQHGPIIRIKSKLNQCTAFVVDKNYAVTAGHCVIDTNNKLRKDEFEVYTSENVLLEGTAQPVGVNLIRDFGLIKGDFSTVKPFEVDFHRWRLKPNRLYFTCGFPNNEVHLVCTPFQVHNNHYFFVSGLGFLYPGASGGPVIDGEVGDAVGINYAVGDGLVYVAPLLGFLGSFELE
jgi:hypothetical protein